MTARLALTFLFVLSCMLVGCSGSGSDEADVRATFDSYIMALQTSNGEAAAELATQSSHDFYAGVLDKALHLEEEKTRALPLIDKMLVVMVRGLVPHDKLREMDGRALMVQVINQEWSRSEEMDKLASGEIDMQVRMIYDEAWGDLVDHNAKQQQEKAMRFVKEDGAWKIDLLHVVMNTGPELRNAIAQTNFSEDQFIQLLVGTRTGKPAPDTIWQPIDPKQ